MKLTKFGMKILGDDPRLTRDENATEKNLKQYSDSQSKERYLRQNYGGTPSQAELEKIAGMLNNSDFSQPPSQYAKDYFTDFLKNAQQTQPVNGTGTREYFEAINMSGDRLVKLGENSESLEKGIEGSVKVSPEELKGYDMNTHLHPKAEGHHFLPSGDVTGQAGDVGFAKQLEPQMKNFIVTEDGHLTSYDREGQGTTLMNYIQLSNGNAVHEKAVDEFVKHVTENSDIKVSKTLLKNASPERLKQLFGKIKMAGL